MLAQFNFAWTLPSNAGREEVEHFDFRKYKYFRIINGKKPKRCSNNKLAIGSCTSFSDRYMIRSKDRLLRFWNINFRIYARPPLPLQP